MKAQITLNPHAFEDWLQFHRPDLWDLWDVTAFYLLDCDEWVQREHPGVWEKWRASLTSADPPTAPCQSEALDKHDAM